MRGESANEMNIYEYFQSFVSSGPFRRAENPLAAQNCIVVIVVVKKTFRYSNVFFYNRTLAYAPIPQFGTLLWKAL
jgi:DNA relaxase NicK